jgi:hypothetical protein
MAHVESALATVVEQRIIDQAAPPHDFDRYTAPVPPGNVHTCGPGPTVRSLPSLVYKIRPLPEITHLAVVAIDNLTLLAPSAFGKSNEMSWKVIDNASRQKKVQAENIGTCTWSQSFRGWHPIKIRAGE